MSKFADRLFYLRTENKLTQEGLCDILKEKYNLETNKSMISRYEKGIHEPGFTFIDYTADYFGVTIDWLMGRSDNKYYSDNLQVKKIPLVRTINSSGQIVNTDNITSYEYSNEDCDFCFKVTDDNMSAIGMKLGSLAFIHVQQSLNNGDVGLFLIDGSPLFYRFFEEDKYIMLKPENQICTPAIFSKKDFKQVLIIGKVITVKFNL